MITSLEFDIFEFLGGSVAVVEEQLLPRGYVPFGEYAYPVVSIHQQHFGMAVRVNRVVRKSDLVALENFHMSKDNQLMKILFPVKIHEFVQKSNQLDALLEHEHPC